MRLILIGPPGAGKGTQAVILSEKLHLKHLCTGDILRGNIKNGTEIGKKAKSFMGKGELVPDDIVIRMMIENIKLENEDNGFILDGFPRTLYQAKKLHAELDRLDLSIDLVIYFKTSLSTVILRLTGRRICKNCGANYHVVNMPTKQEGICDRCNGELYQRIDDTESTIKKRLEVFNNQTNELIDYYKHKGILKEVCGDLEADKVFKQVFAFL